MEDRESETRLVVALAEGSEAAFQAVYESFSTQIFNFVLRSVRDRGQAEDLCQDIWVKVHHEIKGLRSPQAFRVWLYQVATRACIDRARFRRRAPAMVEIPEEFLSEDGDNTPEDNAVMLSNMRTTWQALAALPGRQSMALYLKQVSGCSYEEIAQVLHCSEATVTALLFRARRSFARMYGLLDANQRERCRLLRHVIAAVVDGEATKLQERGVEAHLEECKVCRSQLANFRRAAAGYASLPFLPAASRALPVALAGTASTGSLTLSIAKLVAALTVKAKVVIGAGLFVGAMAGATVAAAAVGVALPSAVDVTALLQGPETNSGPAERDSNTAASMALPGPELGAALADENLATGAAATVPSDSSTRLESAPAAGPEASLPSAVELLDPLLAAVEAVLPPVPELPLPLPALPPLPELPLPLPALPPLPELPLPLPEPSVELPSPPASLPPVAPPVADVVPSPPADVPAAAPPLPPPPAALPEAPAPVPGVVPQLPQLP